MAVQPAWNIDESTSSDPGSHGETPLGSDGEAITSSGLPGIKSCARIDESRSASASASNPFVFSSGDIYIIVTHNGERIEGRVSSHALCFASPIWKKFLFPPWSVNDAKESNVESQQEAATEKDNDSRTDSPISSKEPAPADKRQKIEATGTKQIDFSEDDSSALLVLLRVAHLQFLKIPRHLPYNTLVQIAVLCDQYDCISLVAPWLTTKLWLQDEDAGSLVEGQEQWLFIAWAFGRERVFKMLAQYLVKTAEKSSPWLSMTPMPPGIIESIMNHREWFLEALLSRPYASVREYESRNEKLESKNHVCKEVTRRRHCDAAVYGSYTLGLRRRDLFPLRPATSLSRSVNSLYENVSTLRILRYTCPTTALLHNSCCPRDVREHLNEVYWEYTQMDPCEDSHYLHMEIQRQKTVDVSQEEESDYEEDELLVEV